LEENIEYDEREDELDIVSPHLLIFALIGNQLTIQEDETELSRRKDLEEDTDIDVLTPDEAFPRKPEPYIPAVPTISATAPPEGEETEEVKAARLVGEARNWADAEQDDDNWEGFFISLDLADKLEEEEEVP
jgi:COMPASS component SWD1